MKSRDKVLRSICFVLATSLIGVAFSGCASRAPNPEFAARLAQYQRLAIVCAPAPGADPQYKAIIMNEVEKMVPTRLNFVKKVDCLPNVAVDTSINPPKVDLANKSDYDGIVALVYSYGDGNVVLDMTMIDTKTDHSVWTHQLSTKDKNIQDRLFRHGYWTATEIKWNFYGK